jgi:hypothetical protein
MLNPGLTDLLGYAAAGLVLGTFSAHSLRALRSLAIASNVVFIAYAAFAHLAPVLLLHALLLPLNVWRLRELRADGVRHEGAVAAGPAQRARVEIHQTLGHELQHPAQHARVGARLGQCHGRVSDRDLHSMIKAGIRTATLSRNDDDHPQSGWPLLCCKPPRAAYPTRLARLRKNYTTCRRAAAAKRFPPPHSDFRVSELSWQPP